MRQVYAIILATIVLTGCETWTTVEELFTHPRPYGIGETPEGSPVFRQGWNDGCDSGLGVYGGRLYRVKAYRYKQDLTQIDNPEYYRAWKDAFTYCRWYSWNWVKSWD